MHRFILRFAVPAIAVAVSSGTLAGSPSAISQAAISQAAVPEAAVPAPVQNAPVATTTVTIQNFAFSPAIVTIKAGTTLTWTNRDSDPHTVSATDGSFHSPTLMTGQSYSHTFTTPGRFEYLCTIHPFMTATVVVTP